MSFPSLLTKAIIKNNRVHFTYFDLEDDTAYLEYFNWKAEMGLESVTPASLRRLHRRKLFSSEIFELFKKNNKIKYLEQVSKPKPIKIKTNNIK